MANIDPAPSWAPIRQLETTDRNLAGPGGVLNTQPVSIAARLNLLRDNATALNNAVSGVSSRQDAADSAIASLESQVLDAPGTLSDLDHGAPISVTGDQFPDVLSIDNSRGPVLALNESIADLAQRDEYLIRAVTQIQSGDFTEKSDFKFSKISSESGWAYAVVDKNDRCAFGIKSDGTVWANGIQLESRYLPNANIRAIGDSLTEASISYRNQLLPLLDNKNRIIFNQGIGGQSSQQISSRSGSISTLPEMNFENNTLGQSTTTLTPINVRPLSAPSRTSGVSSMNGWVDGVYGTLSCTHAANSINDVYRFSRKTSGVAKFVLPSTPWRPDIESMDKSINIIWMGTNNIGQIQQILDDYKKLIDGIGSIERRFLILTPINSSPISSGVAPDASHVADAKNLEDSLIGQYGDRVLRVRPWLSQYGNGSSDDQSDITAGCIPRSLKIDAIHLNASAQGYIAAWVAQQINYRGW